MRCFDDDSVIHVNNRVDPVDDAETINFELALSDVGQIERRLDKLGKKARTKEEQAAADVTPPPPPSACCAAPLAQPACRQRRRWAPHALQHGRPQQTAAPSRLPCPQLQ